MMKCSRVILGVACAFAVVASVPAHAQLTSFTITDGSVEFSLSGLTGNRVNGSGGGANLRTNVGGTAIDHLFQNWFWYRASGDTREYALSNQVFGTATGNRCRLVYQEPSNNGTTANALRVEIEYTIHDLSNGGVPRAMLEIGIKWQNLTASTLTVYGFNYNDFDLNGGGGGDSALVHGVNNQVQFVSDGNTKAVYACSSTNNSSYQIATYSTIRDQLTDTGVDNLTNTGSPFGPGDYTGANQWGVSLSATGGYQDSLVSSMVLEITQNTCPGDTNGDGVVNVADLLTVISLWGACP